MRTAYIALSAAMLLCCLGTGEKKAELARQVQASDAMGQWLQTQLLLNEACLGEVVTAGRPLAPATRPARLAYSEALKGAMQYVADGGAADPAIAQLGEDLLRQELSLLHRQNLQLYGRLNAQWDEMQQQGIKSLPPQTPAEVAAAIKAAASSADRVRSRPRGSLIDALKRSQDARPDYGASGRLAAEAGRAQSLEAAAPGQMRSEQLAAIVMSGQPAPGTFGVLSSVAPRNARLPSSAPLELLSPWSLPLMSLARGTEPMEATPPGNPAAVVPAAEDVAYLASVTGLSPAQARSVLQGRLSVEEARRQRGAGGPGDAGSLQDGGALAASAAAPSGQDPRWQPFYYGPRIQHNGWPGTQGSGFQFAPGGGLYDRADTRVNAEADTRLNGEIDRRVNASPDRRLNQQNDPRVNY